MPNTDKIGIYPGSFDPITLGHLDIIERSSKLFDKLIVAVLVNSDKKALFTIDERVKMIKDATKDIRGVEVMSFEGLFVDFANKVHATTSVRGLRAISDFEYELQMSQINRHMSPTIETIFLSTDIKYAYLSSSIVKEIASHKGNIKDFVPSNVIPLLEEKYR